MKKLLYTVYITSTRLQKHSKREFCPWKIKFLTQNPEGDKLCKRCWVDNTKENSFAQTPQFGQPALKEPVSRPVVSSDPRSVREHRHLRRQRWRWLLCGTGPAHNWLSMASANRPGIKRHHRFLQMLFKAFSTDGRLKQTRVLAATAMKQTSEWKGMQTPWRSRRSWNCCMAQSKVFFHRHTARV